MTMTTGALLLSIGIVGAAVLTTALYLLPVAGPPRTLMGSSLRAIERRARRYWIAFGIAVAAMILIDTQSLNPLAKHTVSVYLFGKTMAAAGCWYVVVKIFHPYLDLAEDLAALAAAKNIAAREVARVRVLASVGVLMAAALLTAWVWSTV